MDKEYFLKFPDGTSAPMTSGDFEAVKKRADDQPGTIVTERSEGIVYVSPFKPNSDAPAERTEYQPSLGVAVALSQLPKHNH